MGQDWWIINLDKRQSISWGDFCDSAHGRWQKFTNHLQRRLTAPPDPLGANTSLGSDSHLGVSRKHLKGLILPKPESEAEMKVRDYFELENMRWELRDRGHVSGCIGEHSSDEACVVDPEFKQEYEMSLELCWARLHRKTVQLKLMVIHPVPR